MRRRSFAAPLVGAFGIFVGCAADAPAPPAPSGSALSAPHLAAQAELAGAVFAEELAATEALGGRGVAPASAPPRGQLVRDHVAWLTRVGASMAVTRSNVAAGRAVSDREARVLGALAYRAWVSTRTVLEAVDVAEAPIVAKLRVVTLEELRVIRNALGRPTFSLEAHLADGAAHRRETSTVIVTALDSPSVALHDGVAPIPRETLLDASRNAARILGRLALEGTVSRHPVTGPSDLSRLATVASLLGAPAAPTTALRFEVASGAEDPAAVVAPRLVALLSRRELVDVVLPPTKGTTLAEAIATLDARDPTPTALAAANDTLVRAAFAPLAESLGARDTADGALHVRLPERLHQAVLADLKGNALLETPELGPVDVVLAADCFGARSSSHEKVPGSLAYDTRIDQCRSLLCGPAVDRLAPRARDRAACDTCMVRACGVACVTFGAALPRAETSCSRCRKCPPCAPNADPGDCGHAQAYCSMQFYECTQVCEREVSTAKNVAQCMQSACAEVCAQE